MMFRVVLLMSLVAAVTMELTLQTSIKSHWINFKSKHLKNYKEGEENARQENFKNNVERILEHNLKADLGEHEHRLAVNEFSDMTPEEFREKMLGYKAPAHHHDHDHHDHDHHDHDHHHHNNTLQALKNVPASMDWRAYGAVTRVKNQETCGSCYTFAAAGTVESAWAIATGQLVQLSEQNLLDCSSEKYGYYNGGCQGGLPNEAYRYIIANGGISTEACYQYRNAEGQCTYNAQCRGATMRSYGQVNRADEAGMMAAVAQGPVAVGLDAGQTDFMSYRSGVYSNWNCNNVQGNHAVQVIGYGNEGGRDYWLIKNSWGTTWGEGGYMKMARNVNMCGIANDASYPIV